MKFKCITKLIIILSFCLLSSTYAFNQNNLQDDNLLKHSISGRGGFAANNHFSQHFFVSLQYERIISQKTFIRNASSFLKVDFGKISKLGSRYGIRMYSKAQYGLLLGKKTIKLELATGLIYYYKHKYGSGHGINIVGSVGLRYQKPGKSCFFRMATGLPEYFCISTGFSF